MAVLFEIEHKQYTRPRFFRVRSGIDQRMRRTDYCEEVIGLGNRIRAVAKMVCAPQQPGLRRGRLSLKISPIALQAREGRFVNHADDALAFHRDEIDPNQIVVRHVDHAVAGKCAQREKKKREKNTSESGFHVRENSALIWFGNEIRRQIVGDVACVPREANGFPLQENGTRQSVSLQKISGQAFAVRPWCRQDPVRDRVHGVSATARCRARGR